MRARGALAVAAAVGPGSRQGRKVLKVLGKCIRLLDKQSFPWARPWNRLVKAGLATIEGQKGEAIDHLVAAAAGFDGVHMDLYAAASRRRRGQLLGSEQGGDRFITEADRWMAEQGIVDPERLSNTLAPGIWSS